MISIYYITTNITTYSTAITSSAITITDTAATTTANVDSSVRKQTGN